jgi:predicted transcriptional regulator
MTMTNFNTVLLSIKPKWADLILSGEKTIEVRRKVWINKSIDKVLIYSSTPVQKVVGEFKVARLDTGYISRLIQSYEKHYLKHLLTGSNLSKNEFIEYFEGLEKYNVITIMSTITYPEPKHLSDFGISRPPQNFCYINDKF